jgi:D-aminoacyl-tRNA deacylase
LIGIIYCEYDIAGKNIAAHIERKLKFNRKESDSKYKIQSCIFNDKQVSLIATKESIIDFKIPPMIKNIEFIICASKHSSQSKIPLLSTHTPGNFDTADFGGNPEGLSISNPFSMKKALKELYSQNEGNKMGYQVSYEVTHHGPSLSYPIQFIEVGSSKLQWMDEKACLIAANTILSTIRNYDYSKEVAIGLGGGHYSPAFTKIGLFSEYYIGHIIPKYKAKNLSKEVFEKTVKSNLGKCKYLIIDWKGVPLLVKNRVFEWAKEYQLEILRTNQIELNI